MYGTKRRTLKTKTIKKNQLNFHKLAALPTLVQRSYFWTITARGTVGVLYMRHFRTVEGCTRLEAQSVYCI
jgi:hypothetical protein